MCALSQLRSCQAPGTYKLQATDKRQICLSSCFPLYFFGLLFLLLSFLFFYLLHHHTSINEGNGKQSDPVTCQISFPASIDKGGVMFTPQSDLLNIGVLYGE